MFLPFFHVNYPRRKLYETACFICIYFHTFHVILILVCKTEILHFFLLLGSAVYIVSFRINRNKNNNVNINSILISLIYLFSADMNGFYYCPQVSVLLFFYCKVLFLFLFLPHLFTHSHLILYRYLFLLLYILPFWII